MIYDISYIWGGHHRLLMLILSCCPTDAVVPCTCVRLRRALSPFCLRFAKHGPVVPLHNSGLQAINCQ